VEPTAVEKVGGQQWDEPPGIERCAAQLLPAEETAGDEAKDLDEIVQLRPQLQLEQEDQDVDDDEEHVHGRPGPRPRAVANGNHRQDS
jgi:hypothetical protein